MEKLIELLNDYETLKIGAKPRTILSDGTMYCDCIPGLETLYGELVCGKPYGFIKWLVDNDKIDREKVYEEIGGCIKISGLGPHYSFGAAVIMLLAISNEPIKFLISILK